MDRWLLMLAVPLLAVALGCKSGPVSSRLFAKKELTTYRTPQARVDEARSLAQQSTGQDSPEQQQLVADLGQRLAAEPDPIVRESIMQSIARFDTPAVDQILLAGLKDSDANVRMRCCRAIGSRRHSSSVAALRGVTANDSDLDVRHAATRALGQIGSPDALKALQVALQDRDPGMQLVGIEAARQATGRDLGQDAGAYLALLQEDAPAVAARPEATDNRGLRRWLPY